MTTTSDSLSRNSRAFDVDIGVAPPRPFTAPSVSTKRTFEDVQSGVATSPLFTRQAAAKKPTVVSTCGVSPSSGGVPAVDKATAAPLPTADSCVASAGNKPVPWSADPLGPPDVENDSLPRQTPPPLPPPPQPLEQAEIAPDAHLTTLGLARGANSAEIKKAYRTLALRWHPDRSAPEDMDECNTRFRCINEAYEAALFAAPSPQPLTVTGTVDEMNDATTMCSGNDPAPSSTEGLRRSASRLDEPLQPLAPSTGETQSRATPSSRFTAAQEESGTGILAPVASSTQDTKRNTASSSSENAAPMSGTTFDGSSRTDCESLEPLFFSCDAADQVNENCHDKPAQMSVVSQQPTPSESNVPLRTTLGELFIKHHRTGHGHPNSLALQVTSTNAHHLRFLVASGLPHSIYERPEPVAVASATPITSDASVVGLDEIYGLLQQGAGPVDIDLQWLRNAMRWVVWKLAATERSLAPQFDSKLLTLPSLIHQASQTH